MGDFFHGWRRKIGVLTLGMACVAMGGWVRGLSVEDEIGIPTERNRAMYVNNTGFGVMCSRFSYLDDEVRMNYRAGWSQKSAKVNESQFQECFLSVPDSQLSFAGFRYGENHDATEPHYRMRFVVIPHWSIVIPLTLLSAWLLLSKTRPKATPEKPA